MSLAAGTKLGPYEVLSFVRAGGMGEVYRARDPRLNREVAIKVVSADRLTDAGRRRRFVQEAQAASALNHPHIITIFEIESSGDRDFIVMEFVRGRSLDEVIPRQGMRLSEALRVAIAVADALAAAHARGIVHRDLKPANVMVAVDGAVKVLDFGLAKLLSGDGSPDDDTVTHAGQDDLSATGVIAGTLAYMSPEQVTGEAIDARSDIFSFGVMLYEMVTGVRPFTGRSAPETVSAILRAQPKPPVSVVPELPHDLEKAILRCLRKEPDRRFQHADDLRVALREIKEDCDSGIEVPKARTKSKKLVAWATVLAVLVVSAGLWYRFSLARDDGPAPRIVPLTTLAGSEAAPSISPDGNQVAFVWAEGDGKPHIYLKLVGETEVRRISPDDTADFGPSWSPDGRQIAFLRDWGPHEARLHLTSALGGTDRKLTDFPVHGHAAWPGLSWSRDGRFIAVGRAAPFGSGGERGLFLIPTGSGDPIPITHAPEPSYHYQPAFSPDGRQLAFASCRRPLTCELAVVDLNLESAPVPEVRSPARVIARPDLDISGIAWSPNEGELIFATVEPAARGNLWRVKAHGNSPPERIEIGGFGASSPATVPGRKLLAFARGSGHADIYRFAAGHPAVPVLTSSADQMEPAFSPDGARVAFVSTRSGETADIWVANADGSNSKLLIRGPGQTVSSPQWSPDARRIAFDCQTPDGHWHIWVADADGGAPHQLTRDAGDQANPSWSKDGRWLYFSGNQDGARDVWRIRATGDEVEQLTSGGSGTLPTESPDGTSLLYRPRIGEEAPLLMRPLTGGQASTIAPCVRAVAVAASAIYYVSCGQAVEDLHRRELATGTDRVVGRLDGFRGTVAVSPDEGTVLYDRNVGGEADLWLIENFR